MQGQRSVKKEKNSDYESSRLVFEARDFSRVVVHGCFTKLLSNIKRLKDETDDKRDNEPTDGAAPSNTTL
jgi:hypothetical protein